MSQWHRVLGIDLGTTNSVVTIFSNDKSDAVVIPASETDPSNLLMPSAVYYSPDGQVTVGHEAKRLGKDDPQGLVIEAKRSMGQVDENQPAMCMARNRRIRPEEVSTLILKALKERAEAYTGCVFHDAVITVPANFGDAQRHATEEAARMAGLNPRDLVIEPTAAAIAYQLDEGEGTTWIIYDLGGGTFDVSVLRQEDEMDFRVLGTAGDNELGGSDFDELIVDWALQQLRLSVASLQVSEDLRAQLKVEAEDVKRTLCATQETQEFRIKHPSLDGDERVFALTYEEFKRDADTLIRQTVSHIERALDNASAKHTFNRNEVSGILLVGGSTRFPFIKTLLEQECGLDVNSNQDVDLLVARGAGILASKCEVSKEAVFDEGGRIELDGTAVPPTEFEDLYVADVVSHAIGIGLKDDKYSILVPKDHHVPFEQSFPGFTPAYPDATSVVVVVFQGDNSTASLNSEIGRVIIPDIPLAPQEERMFTVYVHLEGNGSVKASVIQDATEKQWNIQFTRKHALIQQERAEIQKTAQTKRAPGEASRANSASANSTSDAEVSSGDGLLEMAHEWLPKLDGRERQLLEEVIKTYQLAQGNNDLKQQANQSKILMNLLEKLRQGST